MSDESLCEMFEWHTKIYAVLLKFQLQCEYPEIMMLLRLLLRYKRNRVSWSTRIPLALSDANNKPMDKKLHPFYSTVMLLVKDLKV